MTLPLSFIPNTPLCPWGGQRENSLFRNFNDTFPAYCSTPSVLAVGFLPKHFKNVYMSSIHKYCGFFYGLLPNLSQAEFFVFTWDDKRLLILDQFVVMKPHVNCWIRGHFVSKEDVLSHSESCSTELNLITTREDNVPNEFRPNAGSSLLYKYSHRPLKAREIGVTGTGLSH